MVNLAVIGAGGYAYELIKRILSLTDVCRLVAVSSGSAHTSKGAELCREMEIPVFSQVDQMLDAVQGQCQVIVVPTPIPTHYDLARKCIEAGFDVFLEKPPVATVQQLDLLDQAAQAKHQSIAVCFQYLYSKLVQNLKERISRGDLGRIKRVRCLAGWERLDSYYSQAHWFGRLRLNDHWVLDGTINNPLAHMLANALYLSAASREHMAEPLSVQAELYRGHDIESEDTSSLRIRTADGAEIIFNATLCPDKETDVSMVIEAEQASIHCTGFSTARIEYADGRRQNLSDPEDQRLHMLKDLITSYREKKPYIAPLKMCRPFTVSVNAAFESSGRVLKVPPVYITRYEKGDSIKTMIHNMDEVLQKAYNQGKLFSEIAVPWAQTTQPVSTRHYTHFVGSELDLEESTLPQNLLLK